MVITVHLVEPNNQLLPGYERALTAGWSPEPVLSVDMGSGSNIYVKSLEIAKGLREASSRRYVQRAPRFGLTRLLVTTHQDNLPSRRVIEATGGLLAGLVPYPSQPGKFRLQFWVYAPARRAGRRNNV